MIKNIDYITYKISYLISIIKTKEIEINTIYELLYRIILITLAVLISYQYC